MRTSPIGHFRRPSRSCQVSGSALMLQGRYAVPDSVLAHPVLRACIVISAARRLEPGSGGIVGLLSINCRIIYRQHLYELEGFRALLSMPVVAALRRA